MAKDVLKIIVEAANSFNKAKPAFIDHPYFTAREKKNWKGVTSFTFSSRSSAPKAPKRA
ncbi:MAG: hypothetical protein ACOYVJ_11440 [Nitrospirota bacterium]